jgi:hypothetical protein
MLYQLELLASTIKLLCFLVKRMAPAEAAVFLELQLVRSLSFVFGRSVVTLLTFSTTQSDNVSHFPSQYNRVSTGLN